MVVACGVPGIQVYEALDRLGQAHRMICPHAGQRDAKQVVGEALGCPDRR